MSHANMDEPEIIAFEAVQEAILALFGKTKMTKFVIKETKTPEHHQILLDISLILSYRGEDRQTNLVVSLERAGSKTKPSCPKSASFRRGMALWCGCVFEAGTLRCVKVGETGPLEFSDHKRI